MSNFKVLITAVVLAVLAIGILSSVFIVRETEQVLVLRFGKPQRVISDPGLNFKIPLADTTTFFDDRVLDYDAPSQEIPTRDQKQLIVDAFARYRITDPLQFYQAVRSELGMQQRFNALINSALRDVLGDVSLAVVLTPKRAELMQDFTQLVAGQGTSFGIEVVDVRIKRIDLPRENSQAIFRRMSTQREQEAKLVRAEGEKESRRIRADADKRERVIVSEAKREAEILRGEGDAEAQATYNSAYGRNVEFFDFWRSMQAMQKGLSSDTTTYVGPPDSDFFRFFGREEGNKSVE